MLPREFMYANWTKQLNKIILEKFIPQIIWRVFNYFACMQYNCTVHFYAPMWNILFFQKKNAWISLFKSTTWNINVNINVVMLILVESTVNKAILKCSTFCTLPSLLYWFYFQMVLLKTPRFGTLKFAHALNLS